MISITVLILLISGSINGAYCLLSIAYCLLPVGTRTIMSNSTPRRIASPRCEIVSVVVEDGDTGKDASLITLLQGPIASLRGGRVSISPLNEQYKIPSIQDRHFHI